MASAIIPRHCSSSDVSRALTSRVPNGSATSLMKSMAQLHLAFLLSAVRCSSEQAGRQTIVAFSFQPALVPKNTLIPSLKLKPRTQPEAQDIHNAIWVYFEAVDPRRGSGAADIAKLLVGSGGRQLANEFPATSVCPDNWGRVGARCYAPPPCERQFASWP